MSKNYEPFVDNLSRRCLCFIGLPIWHYIAREDGYNLTVHWQQFFESTYTVERHSNGSCSSKKKKRNQLNILPILVQPDRLCGYQDQRL